MLVQRKYRIGNLTLEAFWCKDIGLFVKMHITDKGTKLLCINEVCHDTT